VRLGCTNVGGAPDTGLHAPRLLVASWTRALPGVGTSMATCFYGRPSTRTNGQCTRHGWDAQKLEGPSTLVCAHHARWPRRERAHYQVSGRLWPHTSMATPVGARLASARGAVGMHKCWGDPDTDVHPPRLLVASWTHALPGAWTSIATYSCGHPSTRTNGQCTRRGWDAQMLGGPLTLVCTHHALWSRRGRTHYPVYGLLWPLTSLATPVRARMARARGAVGMHKCWKDP